MEHVMDRKAADNKYLHRDFHVSGDIGVAYVGEKYGDNGVREYLRTFAERYYSPLVRQIKERGLQALEEQIRSVYDTEEAPDAVSTCLTEGELRVDISYCPAVRFMKSTGHEPSKWYVELTRTVNETIADNAGLGFEMYGYDPKDGSTSYRFFRRSF
jgi:hypothetical protein